MNQYTKRNGVHPLLDRERLFVERMFPIKQEGQGQRVRMQGEVPWAMALAAYANYYKVYGKDPPQTLQQIADGDGWTWTELFYLLMGEKQTLPISAYIGDGGKR